MKLQNQVIITCNCITPWKYFAMAILQATANRTTRAPENEHQAEKATARGITPKRFNISKKINLIFLTDTNQREKHPRE